MYCLALTISETSDSDLGLSVGGSMEAVELEG